MNLFVVRVVRQFELVLVVVIQRGAIRVKRDVVERLLAFARRNDVALVNGRVVLLRLGVVRLNGRGLVRNHGRILHSLHAILLGAFVLVLAGSFLRVRPLDVVSCRQL